MDLTALIPAFVTLFVVMDPIGLVPLFIGLTQGMGHAQRMAIGLRACVIAAGILFVFAVTGEALLSFVGITMPAFRIAGGVLLFLTALDMLFERRTQRRESQTAPASDPSVFPLAIPLIAGPGAIATMILLVGQQGGGAGAVAVVSGLMLLVIICTYILFLLATPLERVLGRTGTLVVTRILGMLLAALSVQFVIDGLKQSGLF